MSSDDTRPDDAQKPSDGRQRVFIALPLPEDAHAALLKVVGNLQKGAKFTPCPLRWTQPSGLHVTLHFLGSRGPEEIAAITRAIDAVAAHSGPLLVEIKQFGVFPHWRSPSVLWAGVRDRGRRMARLHADLGAALEKALAPFEYEPEAREFRPHLTLARFKGLRGAAAFEKIVKGQPAFKIGPFEAGACALYRSRTLPEGAEYDLLHRAELSGASDIRKNDEDEGAES